MSEFSQQEIAAERQRIARALYDLRYAHRGYPDLGKEMSRKDAIEFQKHLREVGIASLSPEMRSRFDAEYGRLSAEEQREEWDVIIERTAVAHFSQDDLRKFEMYQRKFKNKFGDNWCMKVAAELMRFTGDGIDIRQEQLSQAIFSAVFLKKIERTKSKLLNSLGSMDKRQPNDIGEINGYIDEVIVKLFPELKNRGDAFVRNRLEEILGIERQRPTPS
ncbi:MAG: hypothetical protein AAB416_03555 [Patescibacteria group bacterium]